MSKVSNRKICNFTSKFLIIYDIYILFNFKFFYYMKGKKA
jgi:hypothetical protein